MNKEILKNKLKDAGIREEAYSLDGDKLDAYCIDNSYNDWSVYFFERGLRIGKKHFESESDACSYLLEQLVSDFTTR